MSDTSQGEGWWVASDGKWYPPEQRPGTQPSSAPPPPGQGEKKGSSGCLKWGLILGGILLVFGIGVVACVGVVGNEVVNEIDRQIGTADPGDYEVEITQCESDPDFGTTTASGTITNTSAEAQGFEVEVRFEDAQGNLIEISPTFVDRLAVDQTGNWETSTFAAGAGDPGITCQIDEVSYSIFDE